MNKSILKHEIKSMKWMLLLSILASLFLTIIFSSYLDNEYVSMFSNGLYGNSALIQDALVDTLDMILLIFTLLSMVQIFMQFRMEKNQETGRFLKSLPVNRQEFFRIKLITGLASFTLAFIVLAIGIMLVRSSNMFWIRDMYSISHTAEILIEADSMGNLLKILGLVYLVTLSFYTFLFMIQYTFTNLVGAIVTGVLVWLAPIFIVISSIYTLDKFNFVDMYSSNLGSKIEAFSQWLQPWLYVLNFEYDLASYGIQFGSIGRIYNLGFKYIISLLLILVNIIIAYKFNENSKIENENRLIAFKSTGLIFKFGVTICSGLLVSILLSDAFMLEIPIIVDTFLILLGGSIGCFISQKITRVGNV